MADIETLDEADGYPYSSHISVNGHEIKIGDVFVVFESAEESTVRVAERVYGFTWGSIITHPINGAVQAEVHDTERLSDDLDTTKISVAPKSHQASFYTEEDTVRCLSLYPNWHANGLQFIVVDETRDALSTDFDSQKVGFYDRLSEIVDELYRSPPSTDREAKQLREFLREVGVKEDLLPSTDNHTLEGFDE